METIMRFLPFLIPVVILQLGLMIACWIHIFTHKNYRFGNRILWLAVSFINIIGPVLYFAFGREEE